MVSMDDGCLAFRYWIIQIYDEVFIRILDGLMFGF